MASNNLGSIPNSMNLDCYEPWL